jgi:crotonobetainyl-CoA:carnitine CoA-transferase CaiB-like acyl-CoA transferase
MATMVLADQGADVIKIEPPLLGDTCRYLGSSRNGIGAMFAVLNRNKRSLVLDLKTDADMAIFHKLVATADVILENYRPGIVKKLGIDYDSLTRINPRLIYVSITGYGQSGPYETRKVYDPLIQASSGIASEQHLQSPTNVRTIIFDKVTALTAAQVLTAALLQREKTGRGQHLPISMLHSSLYYIWPDVMWSRTLQGEGITHAGELADYFQVFKAQDGYLSIILIGDPDLEAFCLWAGSELHKDPRVLTLADRIANAAFFQAEIDKLLADKKTEDVCLELDAMGIPVARVNTLDDVHEDPQVNHEQMLIETDHPTIGAMRYPVPPFQLNDQDAFPRRHAPTLGENSTEILTELKIDPEEIERLENREANNRELLKEYT